jgi:hypothetical protein
LWKNFCDEGYGPIVEGMSKKLSKPYLQTLLVCVSTQIFYLFTLAPTVLWGDSANFQRLAYALDIQAGYSYVSHLLWVALAHPFTQIPISDIAFRVNFFTSIWATIAVAFVFATLRNLTNSFWEGVIGAASLMVSHNFWTHAVRTEVYSFNMALFAISLYYFLQPKLNRTYYLFGAITAGFAVINHSMMWLVIPGLTILTIWRAFQEKLPLKSLLPALIVFVLLVVLFSFLLPSNKTMALAYVNPARYIPDWSALPGEAIKLVAYWILQFPSPALIIAIIGIRNSLKNLPLAVCLLFIFAINIVTLFNVNWADKYVFYMLSYFIGALWVGLGVKPVIEWLHQKTRVSYQQVGTILTLTVLIIPIITYTLAPRVLPVFGITSNRLGIREIPGRPALAFFLSPSTRDYWGARQFAETALTDLPRNATIIADYTVAQPILYLKIVENLRPDVNIAVLPVNEQLSFALNESKQTPVFLALTEPYYDIEGLSRYFTIVPEGSIYRLTPIN